MQQLDFFPALEGGRNQAVAPPPSQGAVAYRIADIPIIKPKPYKPDPWDRLRQDFEDVDLAEERARILNQGKKTM